MLTLTLQEWQENEWVTTVMNSYTHDLDGNTISGDVYPKFPDTWRVDSFKLTYNFKRDNYKLAIPDTFVAKYKFIRIK